MYDFYEKYFIKFGQLLVDMETNGIKVIINVNSKINKQYLNEMEKLAIQDQMNCENTFREWLKIFLGEDAKYFNVNSSAQKQQLLFAPSNQGIN